LLVLSVVFSHGDADVRKPIVLKQGMPHKLCLASSTKVLAADGTSPSADQVVADQLLRGQTSSVTVQSAGPVVGYRGMISIVTQAGSYTVTHDHQVTLRWMVPAHVTIDRCPIRKGHPFIMRFTWYARDLLLLPDDSGHSSQSWIVDLPAASSDAASSSSAPALSGADPGDEGLWSALQQMVQATAEDEDAAPSDDDQESAGAFESRSAALHTIQVVLAGKLLGGEWSRVTAVVWEAANSRYVVRYQRPDGGCSSTSYKVDSDKLLTHVAFDTLADARAWGEEWGAAHVGAAAMQVGELFEVAAKTLALKWDTWYVARQRHPYACGAAVRMPQPLRLCAPAQGAASSSAAAEAAQPVALSQTAIDTFERAAEVAEAAGRQDGVADPRLVRFMLKAQGVGEDGIPRYRPARAGDTARIVYQLHCPLDSDNPTLNQRGDVAFTFLQMHRVHKALQLPEDMELVITELNPKKPEGGAGSSAGPDDQPIHSLAVCYKKVCELSCQAVLETGVEVVVAFGSYTEQVWIRLMGWEGKAAANAAGVRMAEIQSQGRTVRMYFAPHPSDWRQYARLVETLAAAHQVDSKSAQLRETVEQLIEDNSDELVVDHLVAWHPLPGPTLQDVAAVDYAVTNIEIVPVLDEQGQEKSESRRYALAGGQLTHNCCAYGTRINLANNTWKEIQDVEAGDVVLGVNSHGTLVPRPVTELLVQGEKACVELTFLDGRQLVCTDDHRILRSDGVWVRARDLRVDQDKVIVGPRYGLPLQSDKLRAATWSLHLSNLEVTLTAADDTNLRKSVAFFRLLGYLMTDGTLKSEHATLYTGHMIDWQLAAEDAELLTGERPPPATMTRNVFMLHLPAKFAADAIALGLEPGKQGKIPRCFPEVLTTITQVCGNEADEHPEAPLKEVETCPLPVVCAFLSGLFGGGGKTASLEPRNGNMKCLGWSMTAVGSGAKAQAAILKKELGRMLRRCDIEVGEWAATSQVTAITEAGRQEIARRKAAGEKLSRKIDLETVGEDDSSLSVSLKLEFSTLSTARFAECIGFAYCCQKQQRLEVAAAIQRTHQFVLRQRLAVQAEVKKTVAAGRTVAARFVAAKATIAQSGRLHPSTISWKADSQTQVDSACSMKAVTTDVRCKALLKLYGATNFFSEKRKKKKYDAEKALEEGDEEEDEDAEEDEAGEVSITRGR
jgi:hypothetical protein